MKKLRHEDLHSLEEYDRLRNEFRARVMQHKKNRRLSIGPNINLYFEDRLTMHYQIQEMLRAERIFEKEGIEEELRAYNPLIPDGSNLKATFMIEYDDPEERRRQLGSMLGIERLVWLQVDGHDKVIPIADEDLERETEEKTSSVHFFRFELTAEMAISLKEGAKLAAGIDHPSYSHTVKPVAEIIRQALIQDLE